MGCEAQAVKPKGSWPIRGLQAKGKTGRVNVSEPLLMPRYVKPRMMEAAAGFRDFAAVMRQVAAGDEGPVV